MEIKIDDLRGPEIKALLEEHLADMYATSPPESVHALDLDKLRQPDITFWTVWEDGDLMGCGALKQLDAGHAEIKSMRTSSRHKRKGVANILLTHILSAAKERGYQRISLETGSVPYFEPARRLYEKLGFQYCGPFADYTEDPYSAYMTMEL
ncbi:GNAT family N-acetyltransferase [Paenibacillus pinistramenti]|uniref:GNAT family N-acetyltransferase n=1 Tax=Paenibacillus pinistramenti TaxID=1768003 RepID=UPI001109428B|nr:GNAT family N-acetyltransferase [Paenibacillus pinistramenti]